MATRSILAIDIGTSSVKTAVISEDGMLLSYSRVALQSFYADRDTAESWGLAIREGLQRLEGLGSVSSVCVTGNGPTLVPLKKDMSPAGPAITWIDTPAKRLDDCDSLYLPRLMHVAQNDPARIESASMFIGCPEYISYLLTGEAVTFLPHDSFTKYIWDEGQISSCGLDAGCFPPMATVGNRIGAVHAAAAEDFGIPSGIPVFAGLIDFHAALLGCGVVRPGMTCDRAGTSEGINFLSSTPLSGKGLRLLPSLIEDTWTVAGLLPASGDVFEWFKKSAGLDHLSYTEVTRLITRSVPQQEYTFYPMKGTTGTLGDDFIGGIFSDGGTCLDDPAQRGRAVVEGIGFSVRRSIKAMRELGCSVDAIRHCGGQARSFHWNYMKAQILRLPIEIPRIVDAELLGCAITAMTGLGTYGNLREAAEGMVSIEHVYSPIQKTAIHYESNYELWCDGYEKSSPLFSS